LAITFFSHVVQFLISARASQKFEALGKSALPANAPTNWQIFSVTFDSDYDTPSVLKTYWDQWV